MKQSSGGKKIEIALRSKCQVWRIDYWTRKELDKG